MEMVNYLGQMFILQLIFWIVQRRNNDSEVTFNNAKNLFAQSRHRIHNRLLLSSRNESQLFVCL